MIKKILHFVFPPLNQLSVFVFSATLISMFFYVGALSKVAVFIFEGALHSVRYIFRDPKDFFYSVIVLLPCLWAVLCALYVISAPLAAPFVKRDLRQPSAFTIFIDAVIVLVAGVMDLEGNAVVRSFIIIYALAWIVFIDFTSDYRSLCMLITNDRKNPWAVLAAGTFSVVLAAILIQFFDMHWINTYLFATISTLVAVKLVEDGYRILGRK